jgi:ubiquinone/menaquinone biosynthesis C-methylase UbiE
MVRSRRFGMNWQRAMAEQPIRFDDGAAYERMTGTWSRLAGEVFLDWLAPQAGLRWLDVGCGNGACVEMLCPRHDTGSILAIDRSASLEARPE